MPRRNKPRGPGQPLQIPRGALLDVRPKVLCAVAGPSLETRASATQMAGDPRAQTQIIPGVDDEAQVFNYAAHQVVQKNLDYLIVFPNKVVACANPIDLVLRSRDIFAMPAPRMVQTPAGSGFGYQAFCGDESVLIDKMDAETEIETLAWGCLIVKRAVLVDLATKTAGAFSPTLDAHGIIVNPPLVAFSKRAREAGYVIVMRVDHLCDFLQEMPVGVIYAALRKAQGQQAVRGNGKDGQPGSESSIITEV